MSNDPSLRGFGSSPYKTRPCPSTTKHQEYSYPRSKANNLSSSVNFRDKLMSTV